MSSGTITACSSVGTNAINKAVPGYIKFNNGLIIQWCNVTENDTVTYPISFSMVPAIAGIRGTTESTKVTAQYGIVATSSSAYIYTNQSTGIVKFIAIGY